MLKRNQWMLRKSTALGRQLSAQPSNRPQPPNITSEVTRWRRVGFPYAHSLETAAFTSTDQLKTDYCRDVSLYRPSEFTRSEASTSST